MPFSLTPSQRQLILYCILAVGVLLAIGGVVYLLTGGTTETAGGVATAAITLAASAAAKRGRSRGTVENTQDIVEAVQVAVVETVARLEANQAAAEADLAENRAEVAQLDDDEKRAEGNVTLGTG